MAQTTLNTLDRLRPIIAKFYRATPEEVTPAFSLSHENAKDSLSLVEAEMAVEEEFGIEIPDEDLEAMSTVQDVIDYIAKHE
jgi:acyl carrier protein